MESTLELQKKVYCRIAEQKQMVASDPYRLHYHLMPPVGLLNDPNGLVFYQGKYHIFYQWNPFETAHGAKFWGHYVSDDLIHFEDVGIALAPDSWYDKNGCYSGSAVVQDDTLYLFYTGNVKDKDDNRESYQCLAVSEDGITFEKKGPVITLPAGYTAHFRDPKVFFHQDTWYMVLGAQTVEEKGEAVLYRSSDLVDWEFLGPIAGSGRNGLGDFGYMWECPDLFSLGGEDVLLVCPQGLEPKGYDFQNIFQSGYFAGKLDLEGSRLRHDDFTELDRGFDFYAPQTMLDEKGRRLLVGWMGNAEEPDVVQPTVSHNWIHALTIPRTLEWREGRLYQHPIEELRLLRGKEVSHDVVLADVQNTVLDHVEGHVFELLLRIVDREAKRFSVEIGNSIRIQYDYERKLFTLEREKFNQAGKYEARHCLIDDLRKVHIFKDTSSVEIFINDGAEVLTARVFDETGSEKILFSADGRVRVNLSKWDLERATTY